MPCSAAMIEKVLTALTEDEVESTVAAMKKANIDLVPVVDEKGVAVGAFTYHQLFENLLPVAVSDGFGGSINIGAAPGVAKRLKKVLPLKVSDLMDRKITAVYPETPLWEGVGLLVQTNAPVLVVEPKSGKLLGVITNQSALDELNRLKDSEA
jgi:CBS-domain-containing membrane protein